jgi:hypothetical protein
MATTTAHQEQTMNTTAAASMYLAKLATYDRSLVVEMLAELRIRNARTRSSQTETATRLMIDCCEIHLAA